MDSIIPIIPSKSILIKDMRDKWNWNEFDSYISDIKLEKGNNYEISTSKKVLDDIPGEHCRVIEHESKQFIQNIFVMDFNFNLEITKSWLNQMKIGDVHEWHAHPFSVVSGVIFLDDNPENLLLQFKNKINDTIPPYSLHDTDYYISLKELVDSDHDNLFRHMVLFYSNIQHGVSRVSSSRNTISFNTFWKGEIDFGAELVSHRFI